MPNMLKGIFTFDKKMFIEFQVYKLILLRSFPLCTVYVIRYSVCYSITLFNLYLPFLALQDGFYADRIKYFRYLLTELQFLSAEGNVIPKEI